VLAGNDFTKHPDVLRRPAAEAFTHMSYMKVFRAVEKKEIDRIMKKANG
jgi:hypothetical protein